MTFSDIVYNDPNKPDPTRQILREYSLYNRKANKAIETERKAHPWWTLASGIASSFVPFGLGAWITPTADYMVQKHKEQIIDKQNDYRARLGLPQDGTIPSSGLNLGGIGYGMGSSIATGLGRDVVPGGEQTLSVSGGDVGGAANMLASTYSPVTTTSQNLPTAPTQEGQTLNLPQSEYWQNGGGGVSGLYAVTSQGNVQGAPTSATYRKGGKVEAPSHEEGGAPLLKDGKDTGFEIEGNERIVNKDDWAAIKKMLKAKDNKSALLLMKDIDKRKPEEKKFDESGNTEFTTSANNMLSPTPIELDPQLDFSDPQQPYFANVLPFKLGGNPPVAGDDSYYSQPTVTDNESVTITPQGKTVRTSKKVSTPMDYSSILGYGYDVARLGAGIEGAMTPLPKWQIPQQWGEYMKKANYLSQQGILPESEAMAKRYADANYATAVRDVANASGGNAAAVLANLSAINAKRDNVAAQLAEVDSKLKAANLKSYEGTLLKDVNMKKDIFDMERNVAERTKAAGAGLMQSAISDLQNRSDMDKFYGEGSYFKKMQEEQLKQGKSLSEIYAMQLDVMKNPEKYPDITANLTEGDKKLIRNEAAIAEAQKLAGKKEEGFDAVLKALGIANLLSSQKTTTKTRSKK